METPKHQFDTRVCTSPMDTSAPSSTAFAVKLPIRTVRTVQPRKLATWAGIGFPCLRLRGWIETHDGRDS